MYKEHKIAVVIPAYNEQMLLPETVKGLPEFLDKIIIINDNSTDNTLELIKEFSKSDNRIITINHESNLGLGQSLH